jgi:hypothetical protein
MSNFQIQEPHFEKEQQAKEGLNLSALAVRERPVTLFFLLTFIIAGAFHRRLNITRCFAIAGLTSSFGPKHLFGPKNVTETTN